MAQDGFFSSGKGEEPAGHCPQMGYFLLGLDKVFFRLGKAVLGLTPMDATLHGAAFGHSQYVFHCPSCAGLLRHSSLGGEGWIACYGWKAQGQTSMAHHVSLLRPYDDCDILGRLSWGRLDAVAGDIAVAVPYSDQPGAFGCNATLQCSGQGGRNLKGVGRGKGHVIDGMIPLALLTPKRLDPASVSGIRMNEVGSVAHTVKKVDGNNTNEKRSCGLLV